MPEINEYINGFNLKNLTLGNFQLKNINIRHEQIVRYNKYQYPTKLTFEYLSNDYPTYENITKFISDFNQYISTPRKIFTRYGNPYMCYFSREDLFQSKIEYSDNNRKITISCMGYAERV